MSATATSRLRRLILVAALAGALALPVGAQSAGASSAFCTTVLNFHPTPPPTTTNFTSYRKWARTYHSDFATLAREAPNAKTKKLMSNIAKFLKYESHAKNERSMAHYALTHRALWTKGWKSFTKDLLSCATSLY